VENGIWSLYKGNDKVQLLGLDLYNGSQIQVAQYRAVTKVTFPLLMQAGPASNYGVLGVEYMMVVDQEGIVRAITGVDVAEVNRLVSVLLTPAPILDLRPSTLYFGTQMKVGQSKISVLELGNSGTADLVVHDVTWDIPGLVVDPTALTVSPGEKGTVTFNLVPTAEGDVSGNVTLLTNDPTQTSLPVPMQPVTVEGSLAPAISLSEASLAFGAVEVGRAAVATVTVRNTGQGELNVTSVQSTSDGVSVQDRSFSVAGGGERTVSVTLVAPSAGTFDGVLEVSSDDPAQSLIQLPVSWTASVVYGDARTDFDRNGQVDFTDFLAFVSAFGGTHPDFDLDGSGRVDFADFLVFAASFGRPLG